MEWYYKGPCSSAVNGSGIGSVVPEAMYNAIFRGGDLAFYTYAGLTSTSSLVDFANSSDPVLRKREAAAFLANVWQETQGAVFKEEVDKSNNYCCPQNGTANGIACPTTYGCPAPIPAGATSAYYGRGAIQLTWNYNYKPAGDYIGMDLLNHPEYVLNAGGGVAWKTSVWYWMVQNGPNTQTAHNGILKSHDSGGFGETIKSINGWYECPSLGGNGSYTQQRDNRRTKYKLYCDLLHVSYGNNDSC
jgi:predicted chitinase